jgi:hypothetical protein
MRFMRDRYTHIPRINGCSRPRSSLPTHPLCSTDILFFLCRRTFKVDTMFSKFNCEDYVDAAVKQVARAHQCL